MKLYVPRSFVVSGFTLLILLSGQRTDGQASHADRSPAASLSSLAVDAQGPISAALGNDDSGYWVHRSIKGFRAENPRHALIAEFTRAGAEVRTQNLSWRLQTRGYGYGDALRPVKAVNPQAKSNRVEYRRDGLTEWYQNGPLGLEQGFTLAHRPRKANEQALTLELALSRDLVASVKKAGKALELTSKGGEATLRYTGLEARDATGRELRSWLEVRGERLLLRVEDVGARYPIVVDPWIQQAELTASDGGGNFGLSVAVDGSTAVVGSPLHTVGSEDAPQGAAYVFVESGGTWTQEAELTASDGMPGDYFGWSVAVDGSTAVVGARCHAANLGDDCGPGAAYVFVESAGTWSQQAELTAPDGANGDYFGYSVAISGGTAFVGAPCHPETSQDCLYAGNIGGPGSVYEFVEKGGAWSQLAELTASDGVAGDAFGDSIAVSAGKIVVGADCHPYLGNQNCGPGAAYVFVESGGIWSQQAELTASDGETLDYFGSSVATTGSTAVIGAPCHSLGNRVCGSGAAYVFVKSAGTWSQQAEITSSDGVIGDSFSDSVAMSGNTLVVGAMGHLDGSTGGQGAVYVFGSSGPLYTLSASPTSFSVGQGEQETVTITITPSNGFSGSVSLSASDLPEGVTASFNPNPASSTTALTLTASTATTTGSSEVVLVGTSGGLAQTLTTPLTLTPTTTVMLPTTLLKFGRVALNNTSGTQTAEIENTGNATLDLTSINASVDFAVSSTNCKATLAIGKSCWVKVIFQPTQLGALTGTLTFTDNVPNSPQSVTLSGAGIEPATLIPAMATYADQKVGTTSAAKIFTLTNSQSTALTSIVISTTGDFALSTTTCGASLVAKGKCTVSVTFTPAETGKRTGYLSISNSASNSPQTANLTGTGD